MNEDDCRSGCHWRRYPHGRRESAHPGGTGPARDTASHIDRLAGQWHDEARRYKRFPEIDFLICCPDGLYAIEVKGGRVTCHNGVRQYQDRYGRTDESPEGPFRQAEAALRGLMEDIRAHLPDGALEPLTTGFGVVFPDCEIA